MKRNPMIDYKDHQTGTVRSAIYAVLAMLAVLVYFIL